MKKEYQSPFTCIVFVGGKKALLQNEVVETSPALNEGLGDAKGNGDVVEDEDDDFGLGKPRWELSSD